MFPKQNLEGKLNVQVATSTIMDNAIQLWLNMYKNMPPWRGGESQVRTLNLPSVVAEEMARLVLTEFNFDLTGSDRAEFIKMQMDHTLNNLSNIVEMWCALGGVVLKPYAAGDDGSGNPDEIRVDVIQANRFYPTAFDSNKRITGAVFIDTKRMGDYIYTRLEYHSLVGDHYTVVNKAFQSERLNTLTTEDDQYSVEHPFMTEISLASVEDWKNIEPVVEMDGIERPFFVYIKTPRANNIDPHSPLGASVYARAVNVIEEVDKQYSRILWEYEAKEVAIDADETLFTSDRQGNPVLPHGTERLYRTYDFGGSERAGFMDVFSPEIRDTAMFNGLNKLFRNVEFLCGLAYGTISDTNLTQTGEKTATEIKASKQRSFTTINSMQKSWTTGLNDLIAVMDTLCTLYDMVPQGDIEKTMDWGDSVLEDKDAEYQRRWAMVIAGKMKLERFYMWYFGCSEEAAKELIPDDGLLFPPEE